MNPKMYVLVRKDLDSPYQAVQAGHAVAEFLIKNPTTIWGNGTLVYLHVEDEKDLSEWEQKLLSKKIPYSFFIEPDIGDQKTALATVLNSEEHCLFRKLNLLK